MGEIAMHAGGFGHIARNCRNRGRVMRRIEIGGEGSRATSNKSDI